MIKSETIQRIKDAARIEEVIGEFVSLKKRGANYIGCCPFHNEKTPSFNVSPAKGIFKCFGCGVSGDAVGFLEKHERYTYPEALRWLAQKYNIEIEEEQLTAEQVERNNERDSLFHVSEYAQKFFEEYMTHDEMGRAIGLSYFHQRGLTDAVIREFGLGYSPEEWSAFTDKARHDGYSDAVLEKTGLTIFKENGKAYDRFRGRVMFPIYSVSGRVLGFSGRILSKEKQAAKYVNSPDSEIYNKSRILYGLYQARSAITKADKCYLVEGNIDVISMYQSGVENAVASCGTSLTVEQVRLIRRYTKNVTVLYDGDNAGIKAAFRAVNMLFEEGLHVRVVLFPDGEDPDSYAQKYGSTQLQQYLQEHETNFVLFKTRVLADSIKGDPIRKAEVLKEMVQTIALVPDLMERSEYVTLCASLLHVQEQTLQTELAKELNRRLLRTLEKKEPAASATESAAPESAAPAEAANLATPATPAAAESPAAAAPAPQQRVEAEAVNPAEYQERSVADLLLNYGNNLVACPVTSESGEVAEEQYTVAQLVVGDILNDQLTFNNPVYQTIFNVYAEAVKRGDETVDASQFVSHPDPAVQSAALSMMMEDFHISQNWARKDIYVPTPEEHLKEELQETLLSFKLKKLDTKIETLDRQFAYTADDEERLMLVAQKMHYIKLRRQIGLQLNRVIL